MNPQLICSQRHWLHSSVGRASHRYRQVTGSNPIEVLNFYFSGFFTQLHKLRSLRWSFLHFQFTFSSHLKIFNVCSNSLACLSTCVTFVYASFCIAFAEWKWCKHLRDNRNSAFQYFKLHQISSRRSPSSKSNKWAITVSVYFFNIWRKYSWAKKIKPV